MNSIFASRILVVEPDPSLRELLRAVLVADGHHVEEAQSGGQAFDKLIESNFDVVLSGAAELDGQHDTPFPHINVFGEATPVLKISADPLSDPAEELSRFMFNPFDLVSIREALATIHQMVEAWRRVVSPAAQTFSAA